MKRFLNLFLLLICSIASFAQGDFRTLRVTQQFQPPRFTDTPSGTIPIGCLMIRSTDNSLWIRSINQWVNISNGAGQSLSFDNGLTATGGTVKWGGAIIQNTVVAGSYNNIDLGLGNSPLSNFNVTTSAGIYMNSFEGSGANSGYFEQSPYGFQLNAFRGGISRSVKIDTSGIRFRKNGFATVAIIRDIPRTTQAFPAVVYDTTTKEFKYNYVSSNTSPAYSFVNGVTDAGTITLHWAEPLHPMPALDWEPTAFPLKQPPETSSAFSAKAMSTTGSEIVALPCLHPDR